MKISPPQRELTPEEKVEEGIRLQGIDSAWRKYSEAPGYSERTAARHMADQALALVALYEGEDAALMRAAQMMLSLKRTREGW